MGSLTELRERLAAKQKVNHDFLTEAGPDLDLGRVSVFDGDVDAKRASFQALNREIDDLAREVESLEMVKSLAEKNEDGYRRSAEPVRDFLFPGTKGAAPTLSTGAPSHGVARYIADHKAYQAWKASGGNGTLVIDIPHVDFKTLVTLTTVSPQNQRLDPINMALEERTVADLMLQGTTDRGIFEYYEETTFTNTAATVAEGGTKPEMTLAWTLRTETVRKIAETIPATKESLDDVTWLESQLRGRLAFAVKRTEEAQLLTGDGLGTNLTGLINRSGIQTQAKGADTTPDAIYKAMQKIRGSAGSGFAEPTGIVVHPADWTEVKLLKDTTGNYLYDGPADEGPDRIWGLTVRQTTAITEGTALVGAFRPHAEVVRREGLTIMVSTEHSTFAVENKVLFIAEERLGLAVYRPSAFATVTGI